MPWTESSSPHFEARHEDSDERGTAAVLELLETTREALARVFPQVPEEVTVVMHATPFALSLAAPALSLAWLASRAPSRRYLGRLVRRLARCTCWRRARSSGARPRCPIRVTC